jgi:hypothetical protein
MLTVAEVADRLKMSVGGVNNLISKKKGCGLYFKKIGRRCFMLEEDYQRYLKETPCIGEVDNGD